MLVHRLRSLHDAILVGSGTVIADNPSLTTRAWPGRDATPVVADRRGRINPVSTRLDTDRLITLGVSTPADMLAILREKGITSVLVEGGAAILQSFIDAGLYDFVRVETSPVRLNTGVPAPAIGLVPADSFEVGTNRIDLYGRVPWWASIR